MQVNKVSVKYKSKKDKFYVVPLGDVHLGNKGCDVNRFKDMVEWIKEKDNCFWIGMGDYIDCINYSDKRFDPNSIDDMYLRDLGNCVPKQIEQFISMVLPISDKCIGLHRGNHEETIRLRYHYDVMYELWRTLGKPILDDSAITEINFRMHNGHSDSIRMFSMHGCCGGRKGGNKINWLEDLIGYIDSDIYLIAHSHIKSSEVKTQLFLDRSGHIRQRKKVLGVTGSFLRGYVEGSSSYIEKMMLPPTDLGVIRIVVVPYRRDIHVSI